MAVLLLTLASAVSLSICDFTQIKYCGESYNEAFVVPEYADINYFIREYFYSTKLRFIHYKRIIVIIYMF